MTRGMDGVRLLPWNGPAGRPCYLVGDGTGYLSRVADTMEAAQLDMADELLDHAADMLGDCWVTAAQLHFLAARLAEALRDVRRVAESRAPASDRTPIPARRTHVQLSVIFARRER